MLRSLKSATTPVELPAGLSTLLGSAQGRQQLPRALFDASVVPLDAKNGLLLVFWGDWHLGAQGTDYARFQDDVQKLATAKGFLGDRLAIIGMGDFIDGYLPSGTPKNPTQLLTPHEQRQATREVFELIQPSVLIEGDHDGWHTRQDVEFEWLFELAQDLKVPYAQWGTQLEVETQHDSVTVLARHRFKGSRATDAIKPQKNLHLELGPADVVALAHVHSNPGCFRVRAKRASEGAYTAVQSGTYKQYDDYAKKLGGYEGEYGVPAVLILPDGSRRTYDHYEDALDEVL